MGRVEFQGGIKLEDGVHFQGEEIDDLAVGQGTRGPAPGAVDLRFGAADLILPLGQDAVREGLEILATIQVVGKPALERVAADVFREAAVFLAGAGVKALLQLAVEGFVVAPGSASTSPARVLTDCPPP